MDLLDYLSQRVRQAPKNQKRKYRRDLVKAVINAYPAGRPIRTAEFGRLLQYEQNSAGATTMLTRMVARGEISRSLIGDRRRGMYTYKVLVPGHTYDIERGKVQDPEDASEIVSEIKPEIKAEPVSEEVLVPVKDVLAASAKLKDSLISQIEGLGVVFTFEQLEELAMKHEFYHPGSTVAEFINTLKEK